MKQKKISEKSIVDRAAEWMDIPLEVVTSKPIIKWIGRELEVEHVHRMLCCQQDKLIFSSQYGLIEINGRKLTIPYFGKDVVVIQGEIQRITLGEDEKK